MKFKELNRLNGFEATSEKEFDTYKAAADYVQVLFNANDCWAYEQTTYANGVISLSIKDNGNKIIYQLKTEKKTNHANKINCSSNTIRARNRLSIEAG